jgi:hypothetical protein
MPPKEAIVTPGPKGPRVSIGDNGAENPWKPSVPVDPKDAVQAWVGTCEREQSAHLSTDSGAPPKPEPESEEKET